MAEPEEENEDPLAEFETVTVEPEAGLIGDGEAVIFDMGEFCEATDSLAAMVRDGNMFVLKRETFKWVNVEELKKAGRLVAVKK